MADYWLDANVFITSKNGAYGFDIAPGFWTFIEQKAADGVVCTSTEVYHELVDESDDELAAWAKENKDSGLFVEPDQPVQEILGDIADWVKSTYPPSQASDFLDGADPWVIAHAKVDQGKVVTLEARVSASSTKVKIPNVCDQFGVECAGPYDMLRSLGASFRLGN